MPGESALTSGRLVPSTPALALCIAFPWVWPIAGGPTPTVMPWLASATSAIMLVLIATLARSNLSMAAAWGWMLAALLSSGIALLQYFGLSASLQPWVNLAPMGEAFGNLRQRNQFATLTNLGLAVALFGTAMNAGARRAALGRSGGQAMARPQCGMWIPTLIATVLLSAANAATLSRTGLFQLAGLGVLVLLWRAYVPAHVVRVFAVAVLVYAAASILLPMAIGRDPFVEGIGARFRQPELACAGRMLLWQNVLHLIAQKPWWGWGWGEVSYAHFVTLYPQGRFCDILDNAHNLPLHLAVVWGIPAALLICGAASIAVWRARPWRESMPVRQLAWAVLAMIGLHSMLEYPLWYGPFQVATVLAMWMLWQTRPQAAVIDDGPLPDVPARHRWTASAALLGGCAALALTGLAYAAWDYHRVSQVYMAPSLRSPAYRDDTLRKVQDSWLFRNQVRFAALTLTAVTRENAQGLNAMARQLLHFSPEARVVEKLIDSDLALGRIDDARYFMQRYRRAFPAEYAHWQSGSTHGPLPALPQTGP